ncbi:GNAT family N-acetyltransferase [Streptomyces sp. NPDC018031]|uniref:GNAT family N-acetyltransferase n=1 Tax=Streptomyces sp. NPDC018031 TaxID=3365033 RepID=UPI0037B29474
MTGRAGVVVRDFRPADAGSLLGMRRLVRPFHVMSPAGLAWQVTGAPAAQRFRLLVAEVEADGEVVGCAGVGLAFDSSEPGQAFANPMVHPDARGRGAGGALLAEAERYLAGLGAESVFAWALADERSRAFAVQRGYRPLRVARYLRLDLRNTPLPRPAAPPPGVRLCTAADLADDPRPLYLADAETTSDEPSDTPGDTLSYPDWLSLYWADPDLDRNLTAVALVDGAVAAFATARTDGRGGYLSAMTGTVRAHRGRGLAKLVKNHSLHLARSAGCTWAYTGNDTGNAPMLAVNEWFGYRPAGTEQRYAAELAARTRDHHR